MKMKYFQNIIKTSKTLPKLLIFCTKCFYTNQINIFKKNIKIKNKVQSGLAKNL